jgi:hypothetical protein
MVLGRCQYGNWKQQRPRLQDSPTSAGVPALATDKVAGVPPGDGVAAALQVGVGGVSSAVGPPGVEVAVVGSLGAGSGTLLDFLDQSRVVGITLVKEVERGGEDAGDSRQGEEEGLDGNHGESWKRVCCSVGCLSLCLGRLMGTRVVSLICYLAGPDVEEVNI